MAKQVPFLGNRLAFRDKPWSSRTRFIRSAQPYSTARSWLGLSRARYDPGPLGFPSSLGRGAGSEEIIYRTYPEPHLRANYFGPDGLRFGNAHREAAVQSLRVFAFLSFAI